ncbi:hypothetical protein [Peribacillus sp. ACCC06369]|uniref:hypothetical protein n=1 Tax=Peribacillus sp. ACCC06369 TaxID=3055860 RepID=UPI0025A14F79|nr:hypothetical protein [Peribacillus sp. ACCC06369]MDM5359700.1 hypothetical protein [Peribacillus sp. ACCC06369]
MDIYIAALIGATGSIIGGLFTLIGVYLTLNHQNKNERYKKLPKNIIDSWKIHKQFAYIAGLSLALEKKPELDDVKEVDEFYKKNEEWVTELSATISPEMYNLVNSFFTHVSDYDSYKTKNKNNEWFEKTEDYSNQIHIIIDSLETEYKEKSK